MRGIGLGLKLPASIIPHPLLTRASAASPVSSGATRVFLCPQTAWSYMAMGNFPYPSSYILNGNGKLPPFPVRVACEALAFDPQQVRLLNA